MEFRRYLHLIRQHVLLVIVTAIVGAGIGYFTTSRVSQYSASTEIYVGSRSFAQDPIQLYAQAGLNQVVATYAQMISSPVITAKAVANTHLRAQPGDVGPSVSAAVVTGTNLIMVTVTDSRPLVAQTLANGISNAFVAQVQKYDPGVAQPGTTPSEPAYVFQDAGLPTIPLSTGVTKKVLLGGIFGLVVAILLILLLDYLNLSIKNAEELERRVDLPVLGSVPLFRRLPQDLGPRGALRRSALVGDDRG